MFEFRETLTLEIPNIGEQVSSFSESYHEQSRGIVIEVAAIHEGLTGNFTFYSAEELAKGLSSWTSPYQKPIIINHDIHSEPLGRVVGASMSQEEDGLPFVAIQAAITSPDAIAKVLDQRYLTGSIGGKAGVVECSICGADWAQASISNIPCNHRKGKTYRGKMAFLNVKNITFKEYSFVNAPADELSGVRAVNKVAEGLEESDWINPVRFFSFDMNKEEVLELAESNNINVFNSVEKKEITPIYMQLKGAFLSALATEMINSESNETISKEEIDVKTETPGMEEDILAVAENLSSSLEDLSNTTESEEEVVEEAQEDADDTSVEEAVSEEESVEESDDTSEEVEEAADEASEDEVTEEEEDTASLQQEEEQVEEQAEVEEEAEADVSDTELNESAVAELESRVEELEAREQALVEENSKLRGMLKQNLAERVVDAKISLGMLEESARAEALEEHIARSASSLADSIVDLSKMGRGFKSDDIPTVEEQSGAVEDENSSVITEGNDDTEVAENNNIDPESYFVDVFMGRRPPV